MINSHLFFSLNPNLATCTPVAEWQPTCVYDNTLGSNSVEMWYDGKQDIWQIQQDGFGKEQHFKERPVDFFVATFGNNVLIPSRSKVRISYKAAPGWKVAIQQLHFTCGPLLLKAPHMTMATYEEKLSGIRLTLAKFYNESEDKDGLGKECCLKMSLTKTQSF